MTVAREAVGGDGDIENIEFLPYGRLRGHKGQVLCVAAPDAKAGEALVATGAEDSTVRLWELLDVPEAPSPQPTPGLPPSSSWAPSKSRILLCICRCFDGEAVTSVVFGPGGCDRLYCSAGSKVFEFDLRAGRKGGVLLTTPTAVFDDGTEEVNEVAVNPKGEYLAAANDSGVVNIYNIRSRRLHKTMRNAHKSICNTVRFRPRTSWDLASGALDSTLVFWDFSSGRARRIVDLAADATTPAASTSNSSRNQLFNPPFVHSVEFTPDGRYLAAGLGDSGVVVFDAKTRNAVRRFDGHSAPVCQVHYPVFESDLVISAGNDRRIFLWDHRSLEQRSTAPAASNTNSCVVGSGEAVSNERQTHPQTGLFWGQSSGGNGNVGSPGDVASVEQNRKTKHHSARKKKKGSKTKVASAVRSSAGTADTRASTDAGRTSRESPGNIASAEGVAKQSTEGDDVTADDERSGGRGLERQECKTEGEGNKVIKDASSIHHAEGSHPISVVLLEEKPNWVSSTSVPYDALLVADTSSEVKILRKRVP